MRVDLGPYLIATKGPAAEEVAMVFTRARSLCEKLGEQVQLFWVAYALQFFHMLRLELGAARELGGRQIELAERSQNPAMRMAAYAAMAETLSDLGEFGAARMISARRESLWTMFRRLFRFWKSESPGRCSWRTRRAISSSSVIRPRRWRESSEALSEASQSGPHSLAFALNLAVELHRYLGDERKARESTEALASLASERGFLLWSAQAVFLRGQALVAEGQVEEGSAELRRGAASVEMTGAVAGAWKLSLAEAYAKLGRSEEGIAAIAEEMELMEKTGLRFLEAELYRVKGELVLLQAPGAISTAESAFRQAVASARRQGAKSWELRATMSLARLLKSQGKRDEARSMLSEIYGWFTEGFDTADLKDARALLDELGG